MKAWLHVAEINLARICFYVILLAHGGVFLTHVHTHMYIYICVAGRYLPMETGWLRGEVEQRPPNETSEALNSARLHQLNV